MRRSIVLVVAAIALWAVVAAFGRARGADTEPAALLAMTPLDRQNLEGNLRWMLARERAARAKDAGLHKALPPRVGVFADAGCWNVGARSVVEALEKAGVPCRVLDKSLLTAEGLAGLEAVVFPGGWAPFQFAAATEAGLMIVKSFAEKGGRVLGICAGGYLLSKKVVWEGDEFPYPIALFDGTAQGPIAGMAPWPGRSPVRLKVTKAGTTRGIDVLKSTDILYYGGAAFIDGSETTVLAIYPDGTPSIIVRPVGKGEVILSGAHVERPAPADGDDSAPAPAISGPMLRALLQLK